MKHVYPLPMEMSYLFICPEEMEKPNELEQMRLTNDLKCLLVVLEVYVPI